jgi:hypothetical protein
MARFKLIEGKSIRDLGVAVIEAAAAHYKDKMASGSAEGAILDLIDRDSLIRQEFSFHYDRTNRDEAGKVVSQTVNICIPDLDGKTHRVVASEDFNLDYVAAEAFGIVTIMGCGQ